MRAFALLVLLTLMTAGCTGPDDGAGGDAGNGDTDGGTNGGGDATVDQDTYALRVVGMPDTATAGTAFTFQLEVQGDVDASSDHIGAHYWANATDDPTGSLGDALACTHLSGAQDVPGTFDVTCQLEEGTWHVYGHLRIQQDGTTYDYWAEAQTVTVSA